ncbi:cysteine desulfurase [Methylobacterium sp. 174MFSha1.1]|uniref:cysteine desulfurase family protein n=1 Tax=Methylobacterium sp. 174MFSha1.1 TaxID=1502749 RepID=UPI0008E745AB|nr:cysteine desulfurase family protein [Methylobacterium sp. 174MFSha1.1]SFU78236.1 cysteine desulfurase [Methylobacterium sp. 174MFSha1.1]
MHPLPADAIYLDHNASSPLDPAVAGAMREYLTKSFGNPHSFEHAFGWAAGQAVEKARSEVAAAVGADPDEIVFTSGATEANNIAVLGICRALPRERRRILVSAIEHKAVLEPALAAKDLFGVEVEMLPVGEDGIVDMPRLRQALDGGVGFVSIMLINNEIGTRQPIEEIASTCREAGAIFHTDAAQALAVEDLDVQSLSVDLMSLSSHKAYGPMGIGALYVARDVPIRPAPLLFGGGQENGLRPGTVPTPLCVGFGAACSLLMNRRSSDRARLSALRARLLGRIVDGVPTATLVGDPIRRHPGNLSIRFANVEAERLIANLQPRIALSTGSACTSGTPEPSHVLTAVGLSVREAREVVRIGLGRFTTTSDVDAAAAIIVQAVAACVDA